AQQGLSHFATDLQHGLSQVDAVAQQGFVQTESAQHGLSHFATAAQHGFVQATSFACVQTPPSQTFSSDS
ncbi:MAG: hypothetical protein AAFX06_23350, partial [Planctomycetota bacterium]